MIDKIRPLHTRFDYTQRLFVTATQNQHRRWIAKNGNDSKKRLCSKEIVEETQDRLTEYPNFSVLGNKTSEKKKNAETPLQCFDALAPLKQSALLCTSGCFICHHPSDNRHLLCGSGRSIANLLLVRRRRF